MKLRKNPQRADKELAEMEVAAKSTQQTMSIKSVVCDEKLRMALIIVCSFHFVQQGSGCSCVRLMTFTPCIQKVRGVLLKFVMRSFSSNVRAPKPLIL